jgi:spore maturation protein CgeB
MNIMVVLPYETFATADVGIGLATAFEKLGHDVTLFQTGEYFEVKDMLVRNWSKKVHAEINIHPADLALEGFFDSIVLNDVELVLMIRGLAIPPNHIRKLKKLGVISVIYNTDDPYDYEANKDIVDDYDFVFSNDRSGELMYKNCKWIPVAADDTKYFFNDSQRYFDLSFIGTFFKERVELFDNCIDDLLNMKTYFAGHWVGDKELHEDAFGKFTAPDSQLRALIGGNINVATSPERINLIYNRTWIVPCPHRDKEWLHNSKFEANNYSPRIFEAALTKSFQLVSGNRRELLREIFDEDELVIYDSHNDFREKLLYFLNNKEAMLTYIEKCYNKVINNHTYKHRAEQILNHIQGGK